MATRLKAVEPTVEEAVGALVEQTQANPVAVFTDEQKFSDFYVRLKEEVSRHVPDLTTAGGRKAIASLAFRVTKAKTSLDKAGLGLTEEARQMIATVNASRKKMTAELDGLAEEVRRPLTEWEAAETARVAECAAAIGQIKAAMVVTEEDTSDTVRARGIEVYNLSFDPDTYRDMAADAEDARKLAIDTLRAAMLRLKKAEDDAAELARLRQAEEERQARDAEEREAKAALQRKSDYASAIIRHIRECREARIDGKTYAWAICLNDVENRIETGDAAIAAFGDRADEVAREAGEASTFIRQQMADEAERHRKEVAERAAQEARDQADRERQEQIDKERAEAQAKIDAANKRARELEEAEQLRQRQAEQAERDAQADRDRIAKQARKDEANKALQRRLKTEAKEAIMSCGVSEDAAQKIVLAIRAREIPHICWSASTAQEA